MHPRVGTFDRIPCRIVLRGWCIIRRPALVALNHERIEVNHCQMILVHVKDTLASNTRRQRGNCGEDRRLWHIAVYRIGSVVVLRSYPGK